MLNFSSFRRVVYNLKRRYGQLAEIYRETEESVDFITGRRIITRNKLSINNAIILPSDLTRNNPFTKSKLLDQLNTGIINVLTRDIIIDTNDLGGYVPLLTDYIIYNGIRYDIRSIDIIEPKVGYYFILRQFQGAVVYAILDYNMIDQFVMAETFNPIPEFGYTISNNISFTETLTIL